MRATCVFVLSLTIITCIVGEFALLGLAASRPVTSQVVFSFDARASNLAEAQATGVRTPATEAGQPGTWAQPGTKKKTVDVTELKSQARELIAMSELLPGQMEQIGGGKLPKDLIDNLKKIEKLAKRIRGEIE